MKRVKPTKRNFCSTDAWQGLLEAINKTAEEVRVKTKHLLEVEECHAAKAYYLDRLSRHCRQARRGRLYVDRAALFKLVRDHGEVCGN